MTAAYLPTFIIGGAPRSGTTFLAEALSRHPDVCMAQPLIPEPKVFLGYRQPPEVYDERYRKLFAGANGHRLRGEKTANYLENPDLCDLMKTVVPDVKFVFIVREPVARAYSNFLWSTKNGLETLSFEEAVAKEGTRASPLPPERFHAKPFDYLIRSNYDALAAPYLKAFGRGPRSLLPVRGHHTAAANAAVGVAGVSSAPPRFRLNGSTWAWSTPPGKSGRRSTPEPNTLCGNACGRRSSVSRP